jgi:ParB/RepB/Spo0J family partition protein
MSDNQPSILPETFARPIFEGEMTVGEILEKLEETESLDFVETTKEFRDSILTYGIINPITLVKDDARGIYAIAAGRRRMKAALELHMTTVPVRVFNMGEVNADAITLIENSQRAENIIAEYKSIQRIMGRARVEGETPTFQLIHRLTGMNPGTIKKRLELAKLHQTLFSAFEQGKISPSVAERICKLDLDTQETLIPVLQKNKKITAHDVKTARSVVSAESFADLPAQLFEGLDELETTTAAPKYAHVLLRVQTDFTTVILAVSFDDSVLKGQIEQAQIDYKDDHIILTRAPFVQ